MHSYFPKKQKKDVAGFFANVEINWFLQGKTTIFKQSIQITEAKLSTLTECVRFTSCFTSLSYDLSKNKKKEVADFLPLLKSRGFCNKKQRSSNKPYKLPKQN